MSSLSRRGPAELLLSSAVSPLLVPSCLVFFSFVRFFFFFSFFSFFSFFPFFSFFSFLPLFASPFSLSANVNVNVNDGDGDGVLVSLFTVLPFPLTLLLSPAPPLPLPLPLPPLSPSRWGDSSRRSLRRRRRRALVEDEVDDVDDADANDNVLPLSCFFLESPCKGGLGPLLAAPSLDARPFRSAGLTLPVEVSPLLAR